MGFEIVVLIVLILINAFFAASEIALITVNDNKIRIMAENGNKKAAIIHKLTSEPSGFLATIQIGITLAGFLASAFAADTFATVLVDYLVARGIEIPRNVLSTASVIVITLVLSYFTLVFGELVPKRLAMKKAESIAMLAASPLHILSKMVAPFVKLLTFSTNMTVRLFGVDPNAEDEEASEEEIRMMIDTGLERGTIQPNERIIINNVFELDNKDAADVMTPRTDVSAIPVDISRDDAIALATAEKYTRYPVYEGHIDNVIGMLHVKDMIGHLVHQEARSWDVRAFMRPPYFVSEHQRGDTLLEEMQQNRIHMAIVVDEYGGTAGIVTIEDLIEEVIGNIYDEYDMDETDYEQIDESTYIFPGSARLDEVRRVVPAELPLEDYDTLSGFVIGTLGRIPTRSEKPEFEYEHFRYKVEEVGRQRINRVRVQRLQTSSLK
ncbi:hemolysin family protein [Paenibacillus bovis]|uniref:Hemolysin n=1 Tax=Paenibacillus bovis TaxID=1616788 RepID=A0A172ZC01_9BACL|nr:hemolysin family protein [Paenibacillus bovis]ANF94892.1 hemolysin [Paenibacillus bovis]